VPGPAELAPFVLLGLLGSAHCAGMCGGFAVTVALGAGASRARATGHSLTYLAGKALTYAVLGLLAARAAHLLTHAGAGLAGSSPEEDAAALEGLRRGLAWVAGLACLLLALSALGLPLFPRVWRARLAGVGGSSRLLKLAFDSARALPASARGFGIGLATGLLPCGLSWAALALATGSQPATAAAGMFLFGVATAPVLLATALAGHLLPLRLRTRLRPVGALLLIVFAVLTVARGGLPRPLAAAEEALPACCQPGE
jgi:sulfite exporter TauE/SafE